MVIKIKITHLYIHVVGWNIKLFYNLIMKYKDNRQKVFFHKFSKEPLSSINNIMISL